jgi:hypothetical protein
LLRDDPIFDLGVDQSRENFLIDELVLGPAQTILDDLVAVSFADAG